MPLAVTYPFLEVFWTMLIFFCFFIWIWLLFVIFSDLFRRSDIGGWGKAGWIIFVIILPYLGVFVYLIAEHKGMTERSMKQERAAAPIDPFRIWFEGEGTAAASLNIGWADRYFTARVSPK